uniref:KIB1-4 beta-propeller domain-containing protein n=1 Tax=Chenopodium quinoa TaxID=63459 RepID=A0A803ML53_CHEQI
MPKQNPRELNPYMRNNGSGYPEDEEQIKSSKDQLLSSSVVGDGGASWRMKALKRAQEQATREGRNVKEVVQERWGSLGHLAASVASQSAAAPRAHLPAINSRRMGACGEAKPGSNNKSRRGNKKCQDFQVSGAGKNQTLAACSKRPRTVDKYSAFNLPIPSEIIYHILLLFPASVLQEIVRFVCKEWNAIINDPLFIRAHLLQSLSSPATTGFLIQDNNLHDAKLKRAFYVHPYDRAISILKLPFEATILGSCNGLLLLQNAIVPKELFVVNLITKAHISLPPLPLTVPRVVVHPKPLVHHKPSAVLAFVPSSGQYKVLYACFVSEYEHPPYLEPGKFKLMVWTVAVDETWRAIDCQGITMSNEAKKTLLSHPFSTAGGYICWFHTDHYLGLALDIDAETMYQFAGPVYQFGPKNRTMYFSRTCCIPMDTGAGIIHMRSPPWCWKVWEMIEPKTGPWGRCTNIDSAGMYSALDRHFHPLRFGGAIPLFISLKTGEFWLFGNVRSTPSITVALVCYNWKTGSIWSSPINWQRHFDLPLLHVNSLLSLKNF